MYVCLLYSLFLKEHYLFKCGRPMQLSACDVCGEPIGGQRHILTEGNSEYEG